MASFSWQQPAWLVVVLAAACALVAYRRATPAQSEAHTWWRTQGVPLAWAVAAAVGALLLGTWLAGSGTSAALALLGVLATAAAVWLTVVVYRPQGTELHGLTHGVLIVLRCLACLLLLVMLGRPTWDWMTRHWQKPLLIVLLDQTESMGLSDTDGATLRSPRASQTNVAFIQAKAALARLDERYETRLLGVGAGVTSLSRWLISPKEPATALAAAVREAGALRSAAGDPPAGILLVSDGADNVSAADALPRAARDLADAGTALWAVGVGPAPGSTPLVELKRLSVPGQLGLRDRLRVPVAARVQGCRTATITIDLLWDADVAGTRTARIDHDIQHIDAAFDVRPPSAGLHRLTARVTLPASSGGAVFETTTIVDVQDESVRVLWVEGPPRPEAATVARLLAGEPRLELTSRYLYAGPGGGSAATPELSWASYDVVVLGGVPATLSGDALEALRHAVTEDGVGLLLCGGRRLFNDAGFGRTPLADVCPTRLVRDDFGLAGPLPFVPTTAGLAHPVLRGAALDTAANPATQPDELAMWRDLPLLGGAALLKDPQPAAEILADDGARHPLLVAQQVGRGRCLAAAWESTWGWALASDEGSRLHRRMWRQLIWWLADRRPRAWVLTDQAGYSLAALSAGQQHVRIRAGVSGLDPDHPAGRQLVRPELVLVAGERRQPLRVERHGNQLTAELPAAAGDFALDAAGEYVLEFRATLTEPGTTGRLPRPDDTLLEARTSFAVIERQLELTPPTANLDLLRAAAEQTGDKGGAYVPLHELPELLERLTQADSRREVWTRRHYGTVTDEPEVLLVVLIITLAIEWAVRKRSGLA
ncbi:MAG: hypothetical protein PVJ57_11590 [Phycisphaerae bacterium]|jgi:hypothetical protein